MMVVLAPDIPVGAPAKGRVVAAGTMTKGEPLIMVVLPTDPSTAGGGGAGIVVGAGITSIGVPLMVVVSPASPAGALATGTVVAGMMRKGSMVVTPICPPALPGMVSAEGLAAGAGMVAGPGTKRSGTPFIVAVVPPSPAGASARGILVGPGIINILDPPITVGLPTRG